MARRRTFLKKMFLPRYLGHGYVGIAGESIELNRQTDKPIQKTKLSAMGWFALGPRGWQ